MYAVGLISTLLFGLIWRPIGAVCLVLIIGLLIIDGVSAIARLARRV